MPGSLPGAVDGLAAGSITELPFTPSTFDAVWCANTLQFLNDDDLVRTLAEFRRVVRPGGLVAVKDVDMTGFRFSPAPPLLASHLAEACITGDDVAPESHGSLRGRELRTWMERSGLVDVRQRASLIERWAPLSAVETQFWSDWLPYLAALAAKRSVPSHDLDTWRRVATPEAAREFVAQPGFYGCELQVVAVGRVPDAGGGS